MAVGDGSKVMGSLGFSIGEVSRAVGLAPQTLRLWERERLVRPRRTVRGYRLYSEGYVRRLREIKQLRKVEGLNFAAIRKHLGPMPAPAPAEEEAADGYDPADGRGSWASSSGGCEPGHTRLSRRCRRRPGSPSRLSRRSSAEARGRRWRP